MVKCCFCALPYLEKLSMTYGFPYSALDALNPRKFDMIPTGPQRTLSSIVFYLQEFPSMLSSIKMQDYLRQHLNINNLHSNPIIRHLPCFI
jgi:hypothetical protein